MRIILWPRSYGCNLHHNCNILNLHLYSCFCKGLIWELIIHASSHVQSCINWFFASSLLVTYIHYKDYKKRRDRNSGIDFFILDTDAQEAKNIILSIYFYFNIMLKT